MSTTYSAGVILGVKLIDIGFKAELIITSYEVHDKKGKPTGKFDKEYSWKINYQGDEINEEGKTLYMETIEELVGLKKPFDLFNINYYDSDFNIDNVVIGSNLTHRNYDDYHYLEEVNPNIFFELIKAELKAQFSVDVDPKLYFYAEVS